MLVTRDLRTLIYLLNLELDIGGCGEQQSKRTQSGSSSRSGRDREQQLERTQAASVQQLLKRAQLGAAVAIAISSPGAACT